MQVLTIQLHFLADRNAEQTVPPLIWPINCIKIGRHVALLSGPAVVTPYSVVGVFTVFGHLPSLGRVFSTVHLLGKQP